MSDNGPGIAPFKLPQLFAVNRPLISSKLKRTPTRGMLGNGLRVVMGAVAALGGTISATTHGRRYDLGVDTVTGETKVFAAADILAVSGVQVEITFPQPLFTDRDYSFARFHWGFPY